MFLYDLDPSNAVESLRFVRFWPEFKFLVVACVIRDSFPRFKNISVKRPALFPGDRLLLHRPSVKKGG